MGDEDYHSSFHNQTVEVLQSDPKGLLGDLSSSVVSYFDLGPGYPDKSLPLLKWMASNQCQVTYMPVDISASFLMVAEKAVNPYVKASQGFHCKFDELPSRISAHGKGQVMVMLGLTFMNFTSDTIISLLKVIAGKGGKVIIASELANAKTEESITSSYRSEEARKLGFGPLANLGFCPEDFDYRVRFYASRVEMYFIARKASAQDGVAFKAGEEIVTAISYRYTSEILQGLLKQFFTSFVMKKSKDGGTAVIVATV